MSLKRKLEFSDVSSVEQPMDSACVHGVVSFVSPTKVSQRGSDYFNGTPSDGNATIKLVSFKGAQQAEMKELMERKQAVVLDDCQIKKAKRGSNMDVILKRTTAICPSPKKFKVDLKEDEVTLLEELQNKEEYERVRVQVKVLGSDGPHHSGKWQKGPRCHCGRFN